MKLWSIYIPGPDEYYAAPSEEIAKHMAAKHNEAMAAYYAKNPPDVVYGPSVESTTAVVAEWPFESEDHTADVAEFVYSDWGLEGGAA